jgi:hypothetical protein
MKRALQVILAIALIGVAFSATLTMLEMRGAGDSGCTTVGPPGSALGYAPCVYGLLMYAAVSVFALLGLRAGRAPPES